MRLAILTGVAAVLMVEGAPVEGVQASGGAAAVQSWSGPGWGSSGLGGTARTSAVPDKAAPSSTPSIDKRTRVSEPSNLMMLVLGLAGLLAGRMAARRRKKL